MLWGSTRDLLDVPGEHVDADDDASQAGPQALDGERQVREVSVVQYTWRSRRRY
jgi:hypothetical protein